MRSLFSCSHKKTSLPITRPRKDREKNRVANIYVVCLKCGKELPYSFQDYKVIEDRRKPRGPSDSPVRDTIRA